MSTHLPTSFKRLIGEGAFASVYEADSDRGPVVVKVARAQMSEGTEATRKVEWTRGELFHTGSCGPWKPVPAEVLEAEAAMLARVDHPAFVRLYRCGTLEFEDGLRVFLELERIEGRTWRQALDSGAPPTLSAFAELVAALDEVREKGTLAYHGDLKPENLMLDTKGHVRILDPCSDLNAHGPGGAPERALYTPAYNPLAEPSDLSALGLILLEILTGTNPLRGERGDRTGVALGPAFCESLATSERMGRGKRFERLADLDRESLSVSLRQQALGALALSCLGLELDGTALDLGPRLATLADLRLALAPHLA